MSAAGEARRVIDQAADFDRAYGTLDGYWDEEPWPEGLNPHDLDAALLETDRVIRAARMVQARIRGVFQRDIATNGPIRIGSTVYGDKPDRTRRLIDEAGLKAWLGDDWGRVVRVDAGNVRMTGLRDVAASRGVDAGAVEDTFFDWEGDGGRVLSPLPVDGKYTPKWAKAMREGERRGGK